MLNYLFGPESTLFERSLAALAGLLLACIPLIACTTLAIAAIQATQPPQALALTAAKAATRLPQATATTVTRTPRPTATTEQAAPPTAQVLAVSVNDAAFRNYLMTVEMQGGLITAATPQPDDALAIAWLLGCFSASITSTMLN